MRKKVLLLVSILLIALLAATLAACTPSENKGYSLELVDKNDYFEFTIGEIDWYSIEFYVYDSEDILVDKVIATESMVYGDDLQKLNTAGTKTITIHYQGASLQVTFKLNNPIVLPTYTIVFNAGEGTFNENGIPTEGSNIKSITDSRIDAIPTPLRDGYEFLGWYEDRQGSGTKLITPYELKRNITVYAKWSDERVFDVIYQRFENNISCGEIERIRNVEYGTEINLRSAEARLGYDFTGYEIWNSDEVYDENKSIKIDYVGVNGTYTWTVTSNITVKLIYNSRMLTLTYISDAWDEGQIVNGVTIIGGVYTTQVAYGTVLQKDAYPVPILPEKEGHSGVWIDAATYKEPLYSIATTDILVRASYTINQFSMYFYDENEVLIENATRKVDYNSCIDNEPVVPPKTGYDGVWMVYNNGYDTTVEDNQLVSVSLKTIKMTSDINVYARYTPKVYEINFNYRLEGMTENYVEKFNYSYGDVIARPVDLTSEREIDGVTYKGYDPKYFDILWYTSSSLSKQVAFPVDVVGAANYYFKAVARPYIAEFRLPAVYETDEFRPDPIYVNVGDKVVPPKANLTGYEIVGWYYNAPAPMYDETVNYNERDYVYYNGEYYNAIRNSVGIVPTNTAYWTRGADRRLYNVEDYADGIPINDFHEYNSDNFYDRAFYAVIVVKQFDVTFNNLVISQGDNGYVYDYVPIGTPVSVNYGTIDISNYAPSDIDVPVYPDGIEGKFIFEGWYLENEFITLPVDLSSYELKSSINLYAKWADELLGTDGLEYTPYAYTEDNNIASYQVSAFNSSLAEYSHVTLRIPNHYNGIPVIAIADGAFASFDKVLYIDEVIIPQNIAYIGDSAFVGCFNTEKFNVSANDSFIVDDCGVLYSADKSVLYAVALNDQSFKSLNSYNVPASVVEIKGGAFAGATNLKSVAFEGVTVENGALVGECSLTKIGSYAFDGCTGIKNIIIPNSVTEIGEFAFRAAYSLNTILIDTENSNLVKVKDGAFDDCISALKSNGDYVTIGNVLVKYLGDAKNLELADDFVAIADGAFNRQLQDENASNYLLEYLRITSASKLQYIGSKAFLSCSNLLRIEILTEGKVEIEADSFNGVALSCKLYVNNSLLEEYLHDENYAFFDEGALLGA